MRIGSAGVLNHVAMKHTPRLIERFKVIKPGQSLKDVPQEHGQIAKMTGLAVEKPFKSNNYRLDPIKPSLAIPASFQSLFLHPNLDRNLTAREAARIMGFPDSYEFKGRRTTMSWEKNLSQYNQIGNAVCPPVATALGYSIIKALNSEQSISGSSKVLHSLTPRPAQSLKSLSKSSPLPVIASISGTEIAVELARLGEVLMGVPGLTFSRQGFQISTAALAAALIFADSMSCPVCLNDKPPLGVHDGEIPFLISKENIHSLQENGQDHGLDYHLRCAFAIPHQVGHLVGEQLAELGLVDLVSVVNQRTGRKVRGMRLNKRGSVPADLKASFLEAICTVLISISASPRSDLCSNTCPEGKSF